MKGINFSIRTVMIMAIALGVLAIVALMASTQLEAISGQLNGSMADSLRW